jgi:hypothetical protein
MPAFKDLTGERFGKLTVIRLSEIKKAHLRWVCKCDCGKLTEVSAANIGKCTKSCGCLRNTQGGLTRKHPLWARWSEMHSRCNNFSDKNYGGRGIRVCKRWHSFKKFLEDVEATYFEGATMDRYPNNDGNYEPSNFRWATPLQQIHNRRSRKN